MVKKHKMDLSSRLKLKSFRLEMLQIARKFFTYFTVFLFAVVNCEYMLFAREDYANKKVLALAYIIIAVVLVVSDLFKEKRLESCMCFLLALLMIVDFVFLQNVYQDRDSAIRLMYYLVIAINFVSMGLDRLHEDLVDKRRR